MQLRVLEGVHLRQILLAAAVLLQDKKEELNVLNVYPVPDGDTGTNMTLTIMAAVREVEQVDNQLSNVARALANGSLMGARGNSGVILSQLFRGFASFLENKETASPLDFALALQEGVKTAYRGVMKPVEGTILTVAREVAKAALHAARQGEDIAGVLERAIQQAKETLVRTPEMLPALKEAGVVDAGGKGLLYILQGALQGLRREELRYEPAPELTEDVAADTAVEKPLELKYQYCTEFILKGKNLDVEEIRKGLSKLGDSVLAVGTRDLVKVHIHSNHPGLVLEFGLERGALQDVKIDNMAQLHRETVIAQQQKKPVATAPRTGCAPGKVNLENGISVVAVALGEGIRTVMESLGVEKVVGGGQTMNPSTEDLVKNIKESRCSKVIILPNNKNVILAAQQAQSLADREVVVIPSKSIPQGIAALLAFNPERSLEANREEMTAALAMVKTGEVTYAARDSRFNGQEIRAGDILGLVNGKLCEVGQDPEGVVLALLSQMVDEESEVITIYYGEEVSAAAAEELAERIRRAYPQCEVEIHYGGQPLYYYIFAVE